MEYQEARYHVFDDTDENGGMQTHALLYVRIMR